MAEGIEVARAIVTIVPSMEGSQREMTNQLTSAGEEAGEKAGKTSGSKFTSSFSSGVKKGAKVMATAVVATAAGTGVMVKSLYDAASATAAYGDNIDKMSQKIGMSSDAYQEWDFIAQHSGTSMESLKSSMIKLSTAAANGSDAFEKLGISQEEAQSMSREELWNRTVMALTSVEDETERARIAQELFGKGAAEMGALLNTSSKDIEAMRQQAHDLGIVMSEEDVKASAAFQDSLQNMTQSFAGLKNRIVADFLPGITTVMDGLTKIFSGDTEGGVALIKEGIASISTKIKEVLPTLIETGAEIVHALLEAISENLPLLVPLATEILTTLGTEIVKALPTLLTAGADIIVNLVGSIVDHAPELVEGAAAAIGALAGGLVDLFPTLIEKGGEMIGKLVEGITGATGDGSSLFNALGELAQNIIGKLGDILPEVGDFGEKIIAALDKHAPGIAQAIRTIMEGFEPFIPAIQDMVKTVADKLPEIIDSFNGIVSQISPIIDSITGLINQIGDTVVSIVDSVGTNLAKIVDAFSDFNESLATPITAIGDAISGIITSISDGVVKINDSIANILEKLSGVFDSIGNAATKAGDGFATVADAAIRLANQTSVIDLVATLGGIAVGIKDINREAGWMADHDIANKLEKIGPPLKTVTSSAKGLDTAAANIASLAGSIKDLNNEVKDSGTIGTNIDTITEAIGGISTQAATTGEDLGKFVDDAITDFTSFSTSVGSTLSSMEETFKGKNYNFKYYMKDAIDNINLLNLNPFVETIRNALTTASNLFASVTWRIPHISTPHFYWSGVWDMDGSDGYMSAPSLNVSWYDKGGVFTQPTVIGIAEKRPEFVGALDDLRDIVREESGPRDVTINVYGAEGQDVRTLADIVMERIQHSIDRQEAVFA